MKVYEARALNRRVVDDLDAVLLAVRDATDLFRNSLILPAVPGNTVYAGEGAGNAALLAEQRFDAAYDKVGVLLRSLEVMREEIRKARRASSQPQHAAGPVRTVGWQIIVGAFLYAVPQGPDGLSESLEGSEQAVLLEEYARQQAASLAAEGMSGVRLVRRVSEREEIRP